MPNLLKHFGRYIDKIYNYHDKTLSDLVRRIYSALQFFGSNDERTTICHLQHYIVQHFLATPFKAFKFFAP